MRLSPAVEKILSHYESDNPGVKGNLARLFLQGRLGNSGRLLIFPVDQGFEHGPSRSFLTNPEALDPHYFYNLACEAELSAYAAPLGALEAGAATFAGRIPTILKLNSSNTLYGKHNAPNQAVTASVKDALRLGCSGVGFTIYPGSDAALDMFEEIREITAEAKACGLVVVVWSYPRSGPQGPLSAKGETALDTVAYGAHMACLLGAHIVKVKLPTAFIESPDFWTPSVQIPVESLADRVHYIVKACFQGRRVVVFSGGEKKSREELLTDAEAIRQGGGHGMILGRNGFQRAYHEALPLLEELTMALKGEPQ